MPANKQAFVLFDAQTLTASGTITGNGTFDLAVSDSQDNSVNAFKALKLITDYSEITPDFGANPQTFFIDVLVEGKSADTQWYPIAYQFSSYKNDVQGAKRVIQLQQNIAGFDAGFDDIIFIGNTTYARVSRQQGNVPDTEWRVRLIVTETDFGGQGSFQSVKISMYGEVFDV